MSFRVLNVFQPINTHLLQLNTFSHIQDTKVLVIICLYFICGDGTKSNSLRLRVRYFLGMLNDGHQLSGIILYYSMWSVLFQTSGWLVVCVWVSV